MYSPIFEGPVEGFVMNFLAKNYWRVERTMTREDVKQEAYEIFLRVTRKYPSLETPQHFMALFKSAWFNHFTDRANEDTRSRIMVQPAIYVDESGAEVIFENTGDTDNDGALAIMLRQAPREISMVLNLFLNAPQEFLEVALAGWQGRDRRCKAGGSRKICQMLGIPEDRDVLKAVEEYFNT